VLPESNAALGAILPPAIEDTSLIAAALAYVVELYRELSQENGAPTPGTQNQAVDFILADPELSRGVSEWGKRTRVGEVTTAPPHRLPCDETYRRVAPFLRKVMEAPRLARQDRD
jgi:hypothetical protein